MNKTISHPLAHFQEPQSQYRCFLCVAVAELPEPFPAASQGLSYQEDGVALGQGRRHPRLDCRDPGQGNIFIIAPNALP